MTLSANAKSLIKGFAELSALVEGAEAAGGVKAAADEAESRLNARRRDIEVEDARLGARVNAADEAERRADRAVKAAQSAADEVRRQAAEECDALRAAASAAVKATRAAADEKLANLQVKIDSAERLAAEADAERVAAQARLEATVAELSALRAKLEA